MTVQELRLSRKLAVSEAIREQLFGCANTLLLDGCPANPDRWICRKQEDFDDQSCMRCWSDYLLRIWRGDMLQIQNDR